MIFKTSRSIKAAALLCAIGVSLSLLLTACGAGGASAAASAQSAASEAGMAQPSQASTLTVAMSNYLMNANNPDGFYTAGVRINDQFQNLMFYDYNTSEERFLCNDPTCTHDHAGCTSFLDTYNTVMPFTAGGKLYVEYGAYNDGSANRDNWPSAIEQRELDGTGAKVIATAEHGDLSSNSTVYADDKAFYTYMRPNGGATAIVARIDFATGERTDVPWPSIDCFEIGATFGDSILGIESKGDGANTVTSLCAVSVKTGEATVLHTWQNGVFGYISEAFKDGKLYYKNATTGEIMAYDVANDTDAIVTDAFTKYAAPVARDEIVANPDGEGLVTVPGSYYPSDWWTVQFMGDWVLGSNLSGVSETENDTITHAYNMSTGETKEITLSDMWNGYEHPLTVMAETPHGLLVVEEHRAFTINTTGQDGKPYSFDSSYSVYALMDIDAFVESQPEYRTIKPIAPVDAN